MVVLGGSPKAIQPLDSGIHLWVERPSRWIGETGEIAKAAMWVCLGACLFIAGQIMVLGSGVVAQIL